ncbi:MAG: 3',5'-cyclic-nucleotide phosphodiesterase [Polaromonas sp.]|nr:3',5'-cyclic-nucleotide phosphodiesterase [Polaromonas sp.]
MKVRVLGCSGAIGKDCRTTSFLLDHDVLVDAGTGVGDLSLDEMASIEHVLLTHSHLDHVVCLPLMVDAVSARRAAPLQVHALQPTLDALQAHIFNNVVWPDFSQIPDREAPFIRFHPLTHGQTLALGGKHIEVLTAVHSVPAAGYAVRGTEQRPDGKNPPNWVFTGDTEINPALWARINQLDVAMLVIETAFSNRESALAKTSRHLSPQSLDDELACIAESQRYPIYITHTKPAETELIMAEIERFNGSGEPGGSAAGGRHDIRWLQAGQVFEV